MAEADRSLALSAQLGSAAAVVVSPLLNLAPAAGTGPRLNQSRPVLPLGECGLSGTAMLSLAPDRRSIDVRVHLDCARPASIRLRRLESRHPGHVGPSHEDHLLIIEIIAIRSGLKQPCTRSRFSLSNRNTFAPFERDGDLQRTGICLSELRASSIVGVRVEPASAADRASRGTRYSAERMLMELEAAECSASAIAACRHVELANLYARQLCVELRPA